MRFFSVAAGVVSSAAALSLLGSVPVFAEELPAIPVVPAQTKVLILPTLDQTGDRPEMQQEHVKVGNHRLEFELLSRGFQVLGPDAALKAARADDIDLDDSDSRGKNTLKQLGKDTGVDWVISLAITDVHKQDKGTMFFKSRRGQAKVFIKVYDLKQGGWVADHAFEDTKTSTRVVGNVGTTGLFKQAIDTTVQRSIANLMAPYQQTVKITDEFSEADLITGEGATTTTPTSAGTTPAATDATSAATTTPASTDAASTASTTPAADQSGASK